MVVPISVEVTNEVVALDKISESRPGLRILRRELPHGSSQKNFVEMAGSFWDDDHAKDPVKD